ncbi:MAG: Polyhydroxyalkanoate synthase [Ilumatobacteraceae bacterium]|nr:Polyhydroxyalkanoate synthase [Ilumatobacteraceae bacterium]
MASSVSPAALLDRIRRDLERSALRVRNGLKHVAGVGTPEVGCTAKEEVWARDKCRLNHYLSDTPKRTPPVLLVMSLVSKGYILDLRPGNSFIEALMAQGLDVYALDWGVPDTADAENSFETYCDQYLPLAAKEVLRHSGAEELIVYGYCFGAVLSLLFVGGHPELPIRALGIMATPIDFSLLGSTNTLFAAGRISPADLVDETGNVPANLVLDGLRTRNITGDLVGYANLLNRLDDSEYIAAHQALIGWSQDHIPFAGACFRQTVEWFMQDNRLVKGTIEMGGRTVDLRSITCPTLSVIGEADHLIPPDSTKPIYDVLPEMEELRFRAGHVGLIVGKSAQRQSIPAIAAWLLSHADPEEAVA